MTKENKEGLHVVTSAFAAYKDTDTIECLIPHQMEQEDIILITKVIHHEKDDTHADYTEIKFLFNGFMMNSSFFGDRYPLQKIGE